MSTFIPQKTQILVLGGGPAGSYASTVLAQEGFNVVLLEAAKFPRYHIGESMLPSCRQFLRFIGLEEAIKNYGFCKKPGATLKLVGEKREAYTDFIRMDPNNGAWNVTRADFDDILLRHAEKSGVRVFENIRAISINFKDGDHHGRPIATKWENVLDNSISGVISFDYLIDATGREGIMAQKYLKHRRINSSLRNIACWGYWKGTDKYGIGTTRENAPWFEALTDQSGWNWFIPLHNGTTSVGVVMNEVASKQRREAAKQREGAAISLKQHYLECLQLSPRLVELLGTGQLIEDGPYPVVQSASDFSYNAPTYSGDHYRLIGDAAAFIDPFFSSGVHLAFTGGLAAAVSVASSIRGQYNEAEVCKYHDAKIGIAYTRFLVVVLSAYKQMRAQDQPVLSDFQEDNFDRAFDIIRPVIQGDADVGKRISEDELQKTIQFCGGVFLPVDPEMHARVAPRLDSELLNLSGPVLTPEEIERLVPNDIEAQLVLKEVNARKGAGAAFSSVGSFSDEVAAGFLACLDKGRLGLMSSTRMTPLPKDELIIRDSMSRFVLKRLQASPVIRSTLYLSLFVMIIALFLI